MKERDILSATKVLVTPMLSVKLHKTYPTKVPNRFVLARPVKRMSMMLPMNMVALARIVGM